MLLGIDVGTGGTRAVVVDAAGKLKGSAILLKARGPKTRKAVAIDGPLPREELFRGQPVTFQRVLEREQAPAHRGHNLGLAADHPPAGVRRRQVPQRQRRARGADDIRLPAAVRARLLLLQHGFTPFPPSLLMRTIRHGS